MELIFYIILIQFIESLIVFPFSISISEKSLSLKEKYSITDFFLDYIERDFYTTIDIGTPSQKIFALISSNSHIFSLSSDDYSPKNFETNKDLKLISQKGFNPSLSSTFNKLKDISLFSKIPKRRAIIKESFSLYNKSPILNEKDNKDSKDIIKDINIIFEEDKKIQKYAIIGLNYDTSNKEIPFIVNELKRLNIIKNYNWSFKFISKTEGQFYIGSLPHNYEKNNKFFNQNMYTTILSSSAGDYSYPWSISFDKLYFMKNNNNYVISQFTRCSLDPNLGFIIGNTKYKNFLLENYFNELIDNNICQLEKTEITKYNQSLLFYGTNGIYEFFTCDKNKFTNKKKQFMPLLFNLNKYNFTFNLNDDDLFMEINNKYYFLVAFPENKNETFYIRCFLGLPFYQKYRLVFNFDSKTIGFYNHYMDINQGDEEDDNGTNENYKNKNDNKILNTNNYIKIIIEVIICIFLIIVAFIVGKKINEKRKKRANELNDDNYEYALQNNKDINKNNVIDNSKGENNNKLMEMSYNI